ncbi:MAG: hypothetical protein N2115_04705 [bacterium]|nr:hypothetical protein [bacterium]
MRFLIESRMEVVDTKTDTVTIFYQAASCKSEHTFAKENLFHENNYNFLPVFVGKNKIVIFRSYVPWDENYVCVVDENGTTWEIWGKPQFLLRELKNMVLLETPEDIITATHKGLPIIGRTKITDESSGLSATIEYPIKTMNTNVEKKIYQVDTGPLLFPHFKKGIDDLKEFISIAYIAFNAEHFADFIIEKQTYLTDNISIPHFSGIIKNVRCKNFLYSTRE